MYVYTSSARVGVLRCIRIYGANVGVPHSPRMASCDGALPMSSYQESTMYAYICIRIYGTRVGVPVYIRMYSSRIYAYIAVYINSPRIASCGGVLPMFFDY